MKQEKSNVKSSSNIVGVATYNVYDSISEAITDLGEAVVLNLVNVQHKTSALNNVRKAVVKPGKEQFRLEATFQIFSDPAAMAAIAGDKTKLETAIQKKVAELEAAWKPPVKEAEEGEEEGPSEVVSSPVPPPVKD